MHLGIVIFAFDQRNDEPIQDKALQKIGEETHLLCIGALAFDRATQKRIGLLPAQVIFNCIAGPTRMACGSGPESS